MEFKPVKSMLEVLQTKRLRMNLETLAGYNTANTGRIVEK
jgi:hypothetical protein